MTGSPTPAPRAATPGQAGLRAGTWSRIGALRSLVKERIVLMVVAATALGYGAAGAAPDGSAVLALVLIGTALLSAGSGVLNNVLEHEVDGRMERTRRRALPRGAVSPRAAAWFGALLLAAGALLLWRGGGLLPTLIGALAALLYLLVYTPMKRRSWLNTPLGAIPGALPPLIGWSAATGGVQAGAWILFAVLFVWQHPHFYAIAWAYRDDYRRAGLKMASEVGAGGSFLTTQVILFLAALIPVSMSLTATGTAGAVYAAGALAIGLLYLAAGVSFARRRDRDSARRLLRASVLYLPALLVIVLADRWLLPA
ncbi:MAG: heme o synthase [Spirochaetaceae bacterium]|nr:heme o synthase [Spirochaetaceae bacterium]